MRQGSLRLRGRRLARAADRAAGPPGRRAGATSWGAAIDAAAGLLKAALADGGPSSVAVIGGARGTNEDAYAWARLAREVIGTANVDAQLDDGLDPTVLGIAPATIDDAAAATTIVLLGPDLKEELPVLYLRVRDAAEKRRTRLLELSPKATGLTPYTWRSVRYEPGQQAGVVRSTLAEAEVAEQLGRGPVVVIVGRANLAEPQEWTTQALAAVLAAAPGAKVLPVLRRGNVRGALAAGLTPGEGGLATAGILDAAANGRIGCLILLGADPLSDVPDADAGPTRARRGADGHRRRHPPDRLGGAGRPRAPGRGVRREGGHHDQPRGARHRAQPEGHRAGIGAGRLDHRRRAGAVARDATSASARSRRCTTSSSPPCPRSRRPRRPRSPRTGTASSSRSRRPRLADVTTPTVTPRSSYDLRLVVSRTLYDAGVAVATSPSLAPLAPGGRLHVHPLDLDRLGATTGTALKVSSASASLVLEVEADPGVARGTAWLPFNQPSSTAGALLDSTAPVIDLRLENLA